MVIGKYEKCYDPGGIDPKSVKAANDGRRKQGVGCTYMLENVPEYISAQAEQVLQAPRKTSRIVLGVDRPGNRLSGFGGRGCQSCGMIDLVAGPLGGAARAVRITRDEESSATGTNSRFKVENLNSDPHPSLDAARIKVVQKSNIDHDYSLALGWDSYKGQEWLARSFVLAKADGVRIVSRDAGIKLITHSDGANSHGHSFSGASGIDLIAGNRDDLETVWEVQPMVKGTNLKNLLKEIMQIQNSILNVLDNFLLAQMNWNISMMSHTHVVTIPGAPSFPSHDALIPSFKNLSDNVSKVLLPLVQSRFENARHLFKYLTPAPKNPKYILSQFNHVN